jgi:hypothetical protein
MKLTFKKERGQLIPHSDEDYAKFSKMADGAVYTVDIKNFDMRTIAQNRAMHLYFTMLAEELNRRQLTVTNVLKVEIDWNPGRVKENLWRPVQEAVLKKKSTTELNKDELDKVYDTLNRALGIKFGVSILFPSIENKD